MTSSSVLAAAMALGLSAGPSPRPSRMQRGGWLRSTPATPEEQLRSRTKRLAKEKRRAKTKAAKDARRRNRR